MIKKSFYSDHDSNFMKWGTHNQEPKPELPDTFDSVSEDIVKAIDTTLNQDSKSHKLDPNIFRNAMSQNGLFDYRPVSFHSNQYHHRNDPEDAIKTFNRNRIGIEVEGARFLLPKHTYHKRTQHEMTSSSIDEDFETIGLARLSIIAASKLSKTYNNIPIVLYFTSLYQTLVATRQLLYLRQQEQVTEQSNSSIYDTIQVKCLDHVNQNTTNLLSFFNNQKQRAPKKRGRKPKQQANHLRSTELYNLNSPEIKAMILLVQPVFSQSSFYNLQSLLAQSVISHIPTVIISPRLKIPKQMLSASSFSNFICCYEESSTYGGYEPPISFYFPWLLRDFIPAIYTYVLEPNVAYIKSIVDHSWHVFSNELKIETRSKDEEDANFFYYVASTDAFSGRPTQRILRNIMSHWDANEITFFNSNSTDN